MNIHHWTTGNVEMTNLRVVAMEHMMINFNFGFINSEFLIPESVSQQPGVMKGAKAILSFFFFLTF